MNFVVEPEKSIPVVREVDVVVAGGGISGMMAALAAARKGTSTLIIDRFGRLGGNMGPGMWAGGSLHLALTFTEGDDESALLNIKGMGGIPEELTKRALALRLDESQLAETEAKHFNLPGLKLGGDYFSDSHSVSFIASKMMKEEGVEMLLSTFVTDPILEGGRVGGLFVENKSGRQAVLSKIVIDATGDADVARRAGAPTKKVECNPGIGLFYAVGGVDWECFERTTKGCDLSTDDRKWMEDVMNVELGTTTYGLERLVPHARKAWEGGTYKIVQRIDGYGKIITRSLRNLQHGVICSRAETSGTLDPGDAIHISTLERRIREYIFETVEFYREYLPGFSDCYIHTVAPFLGARGGRWIDAQYPISGEDVRAGRRFDDVLYIYYDRREGTATDIPYRALIPKGIGGLIATGRSAVPRCPNFRSRYSMLLMGQAAGVAAALCVKKGIGPKDLDVRELQRILVKWGCPLGDDKRLSELGLN